MPFDGRAVPSAFARYLPLGVNNTHPRLISASRPPTTSNHPLKPAHTPPLCPLLCILDGQAVPIVCARYLPLGVKSTPPDLSIPASHRESTSVHTLPLRHPPCNFNSQAVPSACGSVSVSRGQNHQPLPDLCIPASHHLKPHINISLRTPSIKTFATTNPFLIRFGQEFGIGEDNKTSIHHKDPPQSHHPRRHLKTRIHPNNFPLLTAFSTKR